jgi:hypothetical protein
MSAIARKTSDNSRVLKVHGLGVYEGSMYTPLYKVHFEGWDSCGIFRRGQAGRALIQYRYADRMASDKYSCALFQSDGTRTNRCAWII